MGGDIWYTNDYNMEVLTIHKIIKVGDSLGVVIPKNILDGLGWQRGDQMVFGVYDVDALCICRISQEKLKELRPQNFKNE